MIEFLFIIILWNLSFWFYIFDIINIYNFIIIPLIISKILLIFEKDFYLLCSKRFIDFDDKLNKKCLLYIFNLLFKKNKTNKIQSRIIIDTVSEEE
jgi:hypothetical protein